MRCVMSSSGRRRGDTVGLHESRSPLPNRQGSGSPGLHLAKRNRSGSFARSIDALWGSTLGSRSTSRKVGT